MERQNITLSIRKDILQKVKILAAKRGTSVSALLTSQLEELTEQAEGYERASRRHARILQQDINLGTQGSINWSRDELHDR